MNIEFINHVVSFLKSNWYNVSKKDIGFITCITEMESPYWMNFHCSPFWNYNQYMFKKMYKRWVFSNKVYVPFDKG